MEVDSVMARRKEGGKEGGRREEEKRYRDKGVQSR